MAKNTKTKTRTKTRTTKQRDSRDAYLRKTYNISLLEFERLAAVHQGGCWICRKPPKPGKNLAVDHDHVLAKTAKSVRVSVRGVLCWYCNKKVVGRRRRENAEILRRAYDYLMGNKAQELLGG